MDLMDLEIYNQNYRCVKNQYINFVQEKYNISTKATESQLVSLIQSDNLSFLLSYRAFKAFLQTNREQLLKLPGLNFTTEQFFWLMSSQQWCHVNRDQEVVRKAVLSSFPVEAFRVMGPIQNNKYFSLDFQCETGTEMNPEDKCLIGQDVFESHQHESLMNDAPKHSQVFVFKILGIIVLNFNIVINELNQL